ncbi:MAG: hypothetical protein J7L30_00625 [Methanophagales archaeon]|nr:hypothetical protein [Methanophagales archaeon]
MGMDVEMLERLNALPKTIASPNMDLGRLKRIPEYVRRQWWDEITRNESEYYTKHYAKGERNEYLEANMQFAKLKLVIAFAENGEEVPSHAFSDAEMGFLKRLDEEMVYVRRSENAEELADSFYARARSGEGHGFVDIVTTAVKEEHEVLDEILHNIPDDAIALAFKINYQEMIARLEEAAKIYLKKYRPVTVKSDIESVLASARAARESAERRASSLEKELEEITSRISSVERERAEIERRALELERELSEREEALKSADAERERLRRESERLRAKYEAEIREYKDKIERLREDLSAVERKKSELEQAVARSDEELRKKEEELKRLSEVSERMRAEISELKEQSEEIERKSRELDALLRSLRDEDVRSYAITPEEARKMELDFVKSVFERLEELPHPDGKWRKIEVFDDFQRIFAELHRLRKISLSDIERFPRGAGVRALRGFWKKFSFEARVLSHYKDMLLNGFDARKVSLAEIMPFIESLKEEKKVLALASTTGFTDKVIEEVRKSPYPIILVDLKSGEIVYNTLNVDLKPFLYYVQVRR